MSYTVHAQTDLRDKIPEAIKALSTYSLQNNIPMSYIRHDLLEMIETIPNKDHETVLKMLNMERELEIIDAYDKSVWFEVEWTTAYMYGKIDDRIYSTVRQLFSSHPSIEKIVMIYVPWSHDDFKNFEAIQYIRRQDIVVEIWPKWFIASWWVDFLLAWTTRNIYAGASIGVHSWRYLWVSNANSLDKDDERHQPWLDFYDSIDMDQDYYWFVLDNATADEVHWLSPEELVRFDFTDELLPEKDFSD